MAKRKAGKISWKMRHKARDLAYSLRRRRGQALKILRPSTTILFMAILVFSIFVFSGGIFSVLEKPLALLPSGRGWTFVYRGSINMQTLSESFVSAFLYLTGVLGLYLLYRGTKRAYRPREAYIQLIIGFAVALISFYYLTALIQQKLGA